MSPVTSYVTAGSIEQKTYDSLKTELEHGKNVSTNPLQSQKGFEPDIDMYCNENDQNYNNTSQKPVESNQELDEHAMESLYAVNDHVLVRYCDGKKCKYYVGFIENIKIDGRKYTVFFFKTIKKPQLAFRTGKKIDRDVVDDIWIVKKIVMNKNPIKAEESLLAEKSDEMYF